VNWGDKAVLGLVAQDLKDEIGINEEQVGLIASAVFVLFIVGNLGAGAINRSMSLRWSLSVLAIGWSLAMFPVVMSATFTVLLLSRMFLGLLEGPIISARAYGNILVAPARETRSAVRGSDGQFSGRQGPFFIIPLAPLPVAAVGPDHASLLVLRMDPLHKNIPDRPLLV